jgi:glyoxylase-like metal-dependent hydrolase (beta-lactamase superfamily II)
LVQRRRLDRSAYPLASPACRVPPPQRILVPLPLPLRSVNAWLFDGSPAALVDCGVGTPEGYATLRNSLWDSGVDANALRIFLSHGHIDHAGNAARLRREFGAVVHAGEAEKPYVESFRRNADRRYALYGEALRMNGAPADAIQRMRERGESLDPWMEDVPVAAVLQDGAKIRLGDTTATAHATPGHTPGSFVFETEDNDLLTGDTLLEHITSNAIELLDRDRGRYAQYLRTLEAMRRFVGLRALPGHHEPFQITDDLLDDHIAKHEARSKRILDHLDEPRTAWELLPQVFPRLAGDESFLGMCEVVGHLHALEEKGAAHRIPNGVRRFAKAT